MTTSSKAFKRSKKANLKTRVRIIAFENNFNLSMNYDANVKIIDGTFECQQSEKRDS